MNVSKTSKAVFDLATAALFSSNEAGCNSLFSDLLTLTQTSVLNTDNNRINLQVGRLAIPVHYAMCTWSNSDKGQRFVLTLGMEFQKRQSMPALIFMERVYKYVDCLKAQKSFDTYFSELSKAILAEMEANPDLDLESAGAKMLTKMLTEVLKSSLPNIKEDIDVLNKLNPPPLYP